jgi:hypothetical protein
MRDSAVLPVLVDYWRAQKREGEQDVFENVSVSSPGSAPLQLKTASANSRPDRVALLSTGCVSIGIQLYYFIPAHILQEQRLFYTSNQGEPGSVCPFDFKGS